MPKVKISAVEGGLMYVDLMPVAGRAYRWIGKGNLFNRLLSLFRH